GGNDRAAPRAAPMKRGFVIAALLALSLAIALARFRFIHDPPEWDLAMYSLIGGEMVHGAKLYADFWDMKPPGIFAGFMVAEWLTRSHAWSAYLVSVTSAIATLLGVYFAAARFGKTAGLWGAGFWGAVSLHPALYSYLPNTEAPINALVACGFAIWLWRADSIPGAILAGAMFALASLFKQVSVAPALAIAAAAIIVPPRDTTRRRALGMSVLMLAMVPLAWLLVGGYFAATSRGDLFFQTNFVYPRYYGGNVARNLLEGLRPRRLLPPSLRAVMPLVLLSMTGLLCGLLRSLRAPSRQTSFRDASLIALFAGTYIAVAAPGKFFGHYYQLWMVPFCIAAAWGAQVFCELPNPRVRRLTSLIAPLALAGLVIEQTHWFTFSPRQRVSQSHGVGLFVNTLDVGEEIRGMLRADETMFLWCTEPQVYVLAGKRPVAAVLWKKHATEGPLAEWLTRRTLADLESHPPDLLVTWAADTDPTDHPIDRWIATRYVELPGNLNRTPMKLHARLGSGLELRMRVAN
ncbi:MAG: ArnT family glycosyltransferase, partial [Tepidisphaeraceae bacterium]